MKRFDLRARWRILPVIFCSILCTFLPAWAWELEIRERHIRPDEEAMFRLKMQVYGDQEVWVFQNASDLDGIILSLGFDRSQSPFSSLLPVSSIQRTRVLNHLAVEDFSHAVAVPFEVKRYFPSSFLRRVYSQLDAQNRGVLAREFDSWSEAENFLKATVLDPELREQFADVIYIHEGRLKLPVTPDLIALLSENTLRTWFAVRADSFPSNFGADIWLVVEPTEDLTAVSQEFAGFQSEGRVLSRLEAARAQRPGLSLRLPLQAVLSPDLEARLNRIPLEVGPDCHRTALSFHSAVNLPQLGELWVDDVNRLLCRHYRALRVDEALRPGDYLYYLAPGSNEGLHSALHIHGNIVLTKNGVGIANPPLFQRREHMEQIYFPDGRFEIVAFRPLSPGEWLREVQTMASVERRPSCALRLEQSR